MYSNDKDILILGIESSCDETAAAVVKNGRIILSNVIYSQINEHVLYGGVVPEIASRKHIEKIDYVIESALLNANIGINDIDAIAVTYGPGLAGALLVGVCEAKAIAYAANKPLVGVNHIDGHVSANYLSYHDLTPQFICLIVSGGHTYLVIVRDYGKYDIIGRTRDDAAGEVFDKVARRLGLEYPGGPKIDSAAKLGNSNAIVFPKCKVNENQYDFSFSGVKSSVLNYLNKCDMNNIQYDLYDVAASFQKSVIDVLIEHTIKASVEYGINKIAIAGGVAANSKFRESMKLAAIDEKIVYYEPDIMLCTDNAAMISSAGYYCYINGVRMGFDLNAVPNLSLDDKMENMWEKVL